MNRRTLLLWLTAISATALAFIAHLALRLATVERGYEVGLARREERRLIEQQRLLSIEAATLRDSDRIENLARTTLDMEEPPPERVIIVGGRPRTPIAGRMR